MRVRRQGWVALMAAFTRGRHGGEGEAKHAEDLPLPSSSDVLTGYSQRPLFLGIISQSNISYTISQMHHNIYLCGVLYNIHKGI